MAEASAEEPKFLIFGKSGWIGGLVGEELERQVRATCSGEVRSRVRQRTSVRAISVVSIHTTQHSSDTCFLGSCSLHEASRRSAELASQQATALSRSTACTPAAHTLALTT